MSRCELLAMCAADPADVCKGDGAKESDAVETSDFVFLLELLVWCNVAVFCCSEAVTFRAFRFSLSFMAVCS